MNKQITTEFIKKFTEARKLDRDAFLLLFPEHTRQHLDVIEQEFHALVRDCLREHSTHASASQEEPTVKKVNIQ